MRCAWPGNDPQMIAYHDTEWGVPVHDDHIHYEFIVLDAFQAGLSWRTILHKRGAFRRAFADFEPELVAKFRPTDVERLMADTGIVRNRQKVAAAITNAGKFLEIQSEYGSFDRFIWEFVGGSPIVNRWEDGSQIPAVSDEAESMSRELRRCGFSFVGPTICYAYMQGAGLVNDHLVSCFRHAELAQL